MRAFPALALACALSAAVNMAAISVSRAQSYPSRNITIILPLAAGSGMDSIVRIYADKLQQSLGKPVIIDNRPGASLMLAAQAVASAPPDGYTLGVTTATPMAVNPYLFKQMHYDPEKDFIPIALYAKSPFVLVVDPALPVKSVPELIAYLKAQPVALSYSSPGPGTSQHLAMEYMKHLFGLSVTHVPYRNTPQSIMDIASGHINLGFAEAGASVPLVKDGKLRALAVSSAQRLDILADVPAFADAASSKGFEAVSWHMLLAPAGTPKDIVARLHDEMKAIMADPEMKKRISDLGLIPFDTPDENGMRAYIRSEHEKWGTLVKKLGLEGTQ
jgi:tripartite-type tricarboxylate transporter receptor subunit TctC